MIYYSNCPKVLRGSSASELLDDFQATFKIHQEVSQMKTDLESSRSTRTIDILEKYLTLQCRSKGNISGGTRERRGCEPVGGVGVFSPRKF